MTSAGVVQAHGMRCGRVLDWSLLGPICRPSYRRSEIRNAGSAEETRLKDGSKWDADYAGNNLEIVTRRTFSESSTSGPSTF